MGIDKSKLSLIEKLMTLPGNYLQNDTKCCFYISLYHPIYNELTAYDSVPPNIFERVVISIPYKSGIISKITNAFNEINKPVIPEGMSTISYRFPDEVKELAQTDQLDVITGFQLIEGDRRHIILEGLSDKSMSIIRNIIKRTKATTSKVKFLYNPAIRFTNRLYSGFNCSLKTIRLRDTLKDTLSDPKIYDTTKVPKECVDSLTALNNVILAKRIDVLQKINAFPSFDGLIDIESKYCLYY